MPKQERWTSVDDVAEHLGIARDTNQVQAVTNLERSIQDNRPRALIQMATGSGRTIMAVTAIYRLIKFAGARRVLFLVDRGNLAEQAEKEFRSFRTPDDNSYNPRMAVTEDMIATGTDIKPIEVVVFMRSVKSRVLFEQMEGRVVRIIGYNELKAVTPDAVSKTHFLIVDCIGLTETPLADTQPLERKKGVAFKKLLDHVAAAAKPLATNPRLRSTLIEIKRIVEQIIDEVSRDELLSAGFDADANQKAHALVHSFEEYLAQHKDEIEALQFFYSRPHTERLRYEEIKAFHKAISAPPRSWTPPRLWQAYEQIEENKVRCASAERRLTAIVSLVRFAPHQEDELVPFSEQVHERFENWLAQQANKQRTFSAEQRRWLEMLRDHVAQSLELDMEDFTYTPFVERGGIGRARQVFGTDLKSLIDELNEVLAA